MKSINVTYQSVWVEGIIETNAKVSIETGFVFDIEQSDEGADFDNLIAEYVIYDDLIYPVDFDDVYGYYYISKTELMLNHPELYTK